MRETFPTRPGDIPLETTLRWLVDRFGEHAVTLLDHRHGIRPLSPRELVAQTLAALAYSTELAERCTSGQWMAAADALAVGATLHQVGTAMGVEPPEDVAIGLGVWAAAQRRHGHIDTARYEAVMQLLGEGGTENECSCRVRDPGGHHEVRIRDERCPVHQEGEVAVVGDLAIATDWGDEE